MAKEPTPQFVDDEIKGIEDDIGKIQIASAMYIGNSGSAGAFHLGKEGIQNAIDECINANSPADRIMILLDESENRLDVTDNGRGIPFNKIKMVCTMLQSSGKFGREDEKVGASAGQNGVGITAENALSEKFSILSKREGQQATIYFENGDLVEDLKVTKIKGNDHGTTVSFVPSTIYLGQDCKFVYEDIDLWCMDIACTIPPHVTMEFAAQRIGKNIMVTKEYKNEDGLIPMMERLVPEPMITPVRLTGRTKVVEVIRKKDEETKKAIEYDVDRDIGLEFVFTYDRSRDTEVQMKSFCNFVHTVDNGEHAKAVEQGLMVYLKERAKEAMTEKEKKNFDIVVSDVRAGLSICMNVFTTMTPEFGGQSKDKVNNQKLFRPIRLLTFDALDAYFKSNPKELKKITEFIRTNARIRYESTRTKTAVLKDDDFGGMSDYGQAKYAPANNTNKDAYRELFIVEGLSAFGLAKSGRWSTDFQAIYAVRGYGLNSFGKDIVKVMDNVEIRQLLKALRVNIGSRFDIKKCYFKKIIIMTDADADGEYIFSLICAFFLVWLPEIVKAGMLYRAVSPLYRTDGEDLVMDKVEFVEIMDRRIGDSIKIALEQTPDVALNHDQLKEFLLANRDYLEELHRVSHHYWIQPDLMEFIIYNYKDKDFNVVLKQFAPEIRIEEDNIITGVYNGTLQNISINKEFQRRAKPLEELQRVNNNDNIYYKLYERKKNGEYEDLGVQSVGFIMSMCQKFAPIIETRFKGLGEFNGEQLREHVMNPFNRTIIKLTVPDYEYAMNGFKILHGDDPTERKSFLAVGRVNRDQIDN